MELNDAGREVKVPRYVGKYYDLGLDDGALVRLRRRCLALSLGAAAAALGALLLRHGAMDSFLAILPLAFTLFPLLYAGLGSFRLPRTRRPLRSDELEYGIDRVRHSAPAIAVLGGLALAGTLLVHLFLRKTPLSSLGWGDGAFLLGCLAVSVCGALLWKIAGPVRAAETEKKRTWGEE